MSLRSRFAHLLALLLLHPPLAGLAESVDFDEMPAMDDPAMSVAEEYAPLGLHFQMAGAIWSGVSEGDPGGWGLEGTDGPSFMGIDAPVFNMVMRFDWPVGALSFDVGRGASGSSGQLLVFGYRENVFVEMVAIPFPDGVGDWARVEMSEDVDIVVALGIGAVPYGVDGMRWIGPLGDGPDEIEVRLDILPGSERNPIQVERRGVVPMVVFGDDDFDVADLDPATLLFGPGGARPAHGDGHPGDRDGDGRMDLLLHLPVQDSGLAWDATEACLEGALLDGPVVFGCDRITPVGKGRR